MKNFLATILSVVLLLTIIPMAYAEGNNTYKVGDIVQFGSYPQSEVTDETLIAELNSLAPEWDEWTSYGYYSYDWNIQSIVQGDWMKYIDITYNGEKYRAVKFTKYRPSYTSGASYGGNPSQSNNGYYTNRFYWFKFEPINWRILDPDKGFVVSEIVIDSQPYSNTYYIDYSVGDYRYYAFNDLSYSNFASDYKTSSIREWLNNNFYYTAFTVTEKNEIISTTLNNDGYYTSSNKSGYEFFDSDETDDKIFLLSYNEATNSAYGFNSLVNRMTKGSDYSKCQGLCLYDTSTSYPSNMKDGYPDWLLRTSGSNSSSSCVVLYYGTPSSTKEVDITESGIRPALRLKNLVNDAQGKPSDSDGQASDCSCNCHKSGISGFFWKIINFFNKLFKSKQFCACGAKHW